jgi:hypothetical protein
MSWTITILEGLFIAGIGRWIWTGINAQCPYDWVPCDAGPWQVHTPLPRAYLCASIRAFMPTVPGCIVRRRLDFLHALGHRSHRPRL